MNKINVRLLHYTPLEIAVDAIRTCWDSGDKKDTVCNILGENDSGLLNRIVHKFKHESTIEHIHYNFEINGISRLCLQELARHRIASFSVKSTRYTLKELKSAVITSLEDASEFIVLINDETIDNVNLNTLKELQFILQNTTKSNDIVKYCLPECYRTNLKFSINARSLRNFLELRLSKSAHFEIRKLAELIQNALPKEHLILFKNFETEKEK